MRFRLRFESLESRENPSGMTVAYDVPLPDPIPGPSHPGDPVPTTDPVEPPSNPNPDPLPDPIPGPGRPGDPPPAAV